MEYGCIEVVPLASPKPSDAGVLIDAYAIPPLDILGTTIGVAQSTPTKKRPTITRPRKAFILLV
jgi:hypothetical protein